MMKQIVMIGISGCVLALIDSTAEATNLSTGEPCNLGIFDFQDRNAIFRKWVMPPTVVLIASAMVGLLCYRQMKQPENDTQRRKMGVAAGVSLAIFVTSVAVVGLVFFIDAFLPQWLY